MNIDVISDTVCPWCYVGKRRLERALAARPEVRAEIGWRPFMLNPDMPSEGIDRKHYIALKFGSAEIAHERFAAVTAAGAQEGIEFNFAAIERMPNSKNSHQVIRWAGLAGVQDQVVEAIFKAYFIEAADIGDIGVLAALAAANGMDGDWVAQQLRQDADADRVASEDRYARSIGVQGVPCFIVDRKYAVMGAQDPAVFFPVFDLAGGEAVGAP